MYDFRPLELTPAEIQECARLLASVYSEPETLTPEFIDWLYAKNPAGSAMGYNAWSGKELVAHYAVLPVVYRVDREQKKGVLAVNAATDPRHRGQGLFVKVGTGAADLAARGGYEFIVGVANQNSIDGHLRKLGFYLIAPLQVKIGIGRLRAENVAAPFRHLWDQQTFDWRLSNPNGRYSREGAQVLADTRRMGIRAVLSLNPGRLSTERLGRSCAVPKLWIGIGREVRRRGAFLNLPRRFRSSALNLIFRDLSGKLPRLQRDDVFFELLDFDAY